MDNSDVGNPNPTVDDVVAAIKIQKSWRSKFIRRQIRIKHYAASIIQSFARGIITRKKYSSILSGYGKYLKEKYERKQRYSGIQTKEKELQYLKEIPAEGFRSIEKIKRQRCARMIQNTWKTFIRNKSENLNDDSLIEDYCDRDEFFRIRNYITSSPQYTNLLSISDANVEAAIGSPIISEFKLRETFHRIEESVKSKIFDTRKFSSKEALSGNQKSIQDGLKYRRKSTRIDYENVITSNQMANIMTQEYIKNYSQMTEKKIERYKSRHHLKTLMKEVAMCKELPDAFEESNDNEFWKSYSWMKDIVAVDDNSNIDLSEIIEKHMKSTDALLAAQLKFDQNCDQKYKKWSIVTSPYDCSTDPFDLREINRHEDENQDSVERSLWWLSYIAQPSLVSSENDFHDDEVERVASTLRNKLAKEFISKKEKALKFKSIIDTENLKEERLTDFYVNKEFSKKQNYPRPSRRHNEARHIAATKLQSFIRGNSARKLFRIMMAEKQVKLALQNLLHELNNPVLRNTSTTNVGLLQNMVASNFN